jgi:phosphomannomutase
MDDQLDGGAMITASHNPAQYNGVKLIGKGGEIVELGKIKKMALSSPGIGSIKREGRIVYKNISYDYLDYIFSFIELKNIKPFKIVLDASGGVAGVIATALFSQLPGKVIKMNFWPGDQYPDHSLNPLLQESWVPISKEIKRQKADLGILWDGDGDRIIFFDEKGRYIAPYYITALLIKAIFENPSLISRERPKVLHDCRLYQLIKEETEKYGGKFILSKAGHSFFEKRMIKGDILFGAEASGHYYFYKDFYLGDGFIPLLLLLEYLSKTKQSLSSSIRPYQKKYFISEEINIKLKVRDKKLGTENQKSLFHSLISKLPSNGKISYLDGLSVEYSTWRFNLRFSGTEPLLLRLNLEAKDREELRKKQKKILTLVKKEFLC